MRFEEIEREDKKKPIAQMPITSYLRIQYIYIAQVLNALVIVFVCTLYVWVRVSDSWFRIAPNMNFPCFDICWRSNTFSSRIVRNILYMQRVHWSMYRKYSHIPHICRVKHIFVLAQIKRPTVFIDTSKVQFIN